MLTRDELIKRAIRGNIFESVMTYNRVKLKKNVTVVMLADACATAAVLNMNTTLPPCFGILYDPTTSCRECKIKDYCEVMVFRNPKPINIIAESDVQENAPFGFRDGSRAAVFIKVWKSNLYTKGELHQLSLKQFDSLIDIERILTELRKRNLLIHDGKYLGIRRPAA